MTGRIGSDTPKLLENIAVAAARRAGSSWALLLAVSLTLAWLVAGPVFGFSNSWQLIMDTFSSVVTLIMVFLLQRSQIKDSLAMQIKLNEIIAALQGANNHIINIEDMSEEEILMLRKRYQKLATHIHKSDETSTHPVSVEDVMEPIA